MARARAPISKRRRFRILERDEFRCQYCGLCSTETVLHIDHIVPVSAGGGNEEGNLITACRDCNLGKAAGEVEADPIGRTQWHEYQDHLGRIAREVALMFGDPDWLFADGEYTRLKRCVAAMTEGSYVIAADTIRQTGDSYQAYCLFLAVVHALASLKTRGMGLWGYLHLASLHPDLETAIAIGFKTLKPAPPGYWRSLADEVRV